MKIRKQRKKDTNKNRKINHCKKRTTIPITISL